MEKEKEIRCPKCGKLLAKDNDGVLDVKNGNKAVRIYGAVAVAIDCPRCGKTVDLPKKLIVKVPD
jgi:ribosomal protein S27E